MWYKKFTPVLLPALILALAISFSAFADEVDADDSPVYVPGDISQQWEQAQNDATTGPAFLSALMGQAAADPEARGLASAVIGRRGNGEIDLTAGEAELPDADIYADILAYYSLINGLQTGGTVADNTPVTDAEGRELIPLGTFAVTKYCPCSICSGGSGSGITASGKRARSNHTIAADTRLYPFGTQLMIGGIIYTVEDTGGSVRGNTVDIFVDSHAEATSYGTHYLDVYLVQ